MEDRTLEREGKRVKVKAKVKGVKRFAYHDGEIFGRPCYRWLLSFAYLALLYVVLCAMTAGGLYFVTMYTMKVEPRYFGEGSFIGNHPSAIYEPNPSRINRRLIWFHRKVKESYQPFINRLINVINKGYTHNKKLINCDQNKNPGDPKLISEKACIVEPKSRNPYTHYGPCGCYPKVPGGCEGNKTFFGYPDGEPCILLRLNKIRGYYPKPWPNITAIPKQIKADIEGFRKHVQLENKHYKAPKDLFNTSNCFYHRLFFRCRPEYQDDEDHNLVEMSFYPQYGIPFCFYPFWQQQPYHAPFQMVQFKNLKPGKLFMFVCAPFTKDSAHLFNDTLVRIHFMIDQKNIKQLAPDKYI